MKQTSRGPSALRRHLRLLCRLSVTNLQHGLARSCGRSQRRAYGFVHARASRAPSSAASLAWSARPACEPLAPPARAAPCTCDGTAASTACHPSERALSCCGGRTAHAPCSEPLPARSEPAQCSAGAVRVRLPWRLPASRTLPGRLIVCTPHLRTSSCSSRAARPSSSTPRPSPPSPVPGEVSRSMRLADS